MQEYLENITCKKGVLKQYHHCIYFNAYSFLYRFTKNSLIILRQGFAYVSTYWSSIMIVAKVSLICKQTNDAFRHVVTVARRRGSVSTYIRNKTARYRDLRSEKYAMRIRT